MSITHNPELISKLSNCYVLLDTNVFLHAVNNKEFLTLVIKIQKAGCSLLTIPSVVFEFARGAKTIEQFNWYVDFVNNLGVGVFKNVETEIMSDKAFAVLLQKYSKIGKKSISYTDFLLLMLLHKYVHIADKVYLMTSNHQDVPLRVFDRNDIMALEFEEGVQTQALYRNSLAKLQALTSAIQ